MEAFTEVKICEAEAGQIVEPFPWRPALRVCGTSAIASVWLWMAFFQGNGGSPLAVLSFCLLTAAAWALARILRNPAAVAFAYSAWLLPAVFLPEYLFGAGVAPERSVVLLVLSLLLLIALLAVALRREVTLPLKPVTLLAVFCVIYFAIACYVSVAKLHAFGYVGQDIAYFTQTLYTTLHGHLFYSNMYHDLLYSKTVTSDFAGHNQPVLALFLPFYAVHQSAATLLVLRNVFVVLCAWPVYLIARRILSPSLAVTAAIAFLLVPAVAYQNIYDFAPLSLAGFPLLFAVYFFLEDRFRPFLIALACALLVREDLVFAVFGLGLLALWQRRAPRWVAVPCALAAIWAAISWMIVFPHFLQGSTSVVSSCFSYLGNSPAQMISQLPNHAGDILSRHNLIYLKQVTDSFGGVLFLANPAWIISSPYLAINLLGQGGGCNTAMVVRHYTMIPAALLFASFLMSAERVGLFLKKRDRDPNPMQAGMVFFVLAAALSSLMFVTGSDQTEDLRARPWHDEARMVASLVPEGASVAAPRYLLPMLANRAGLYQSLRLLEYHHPDADFIILDKDWSRMAATDQWFADYQRLEELLQVSRDYDRTYNSPGYAIYRRCAGCAGVAGGRP